MPGLRDIHWHRRLASQRSAMFALGLILPIALIASAYFIGDFVRWKSGNDIVNYIVMIVHLFSALLAGWCATMLVATLLFGDGWRVRYLAGEAYSSGDAVDRMVEESKDRSATFFAMFILLSVGLYAGASFLGGHFLLHYDRFAGPMTMLRSEDTAQQIIGMERLAARDDYTEPQTMAIRDQVIDKLGSSDDTVRARSAWAAGQLAVVSTRDALVDALGDESESVRSHAALALARFVLPGTAERLMETFPGAEASDDERVAWLVALGTTRDIAVGAFVEERLPSFEAQSRLAAIWAIGMSGDVCLHSTLIDAFPSASDNEKCVLGDAMKRIGTESDVHSFKSWVDPNDDVWCLRQSIDGPAVNDLGQRDMVILSTQESLREKLMDSVFNTAADGSHGWFDAILRDERFSNTAREHAYFLMKTWEKTPARPIRTAAGCVEGERAGVPMQRSERGDANSDSPEHEVDSQTNTSADQGVEPQ